MSSSHLIVWKGTKQMTVYLNGSIRAGYFLLIVQCCYIYMCCSSSNGFRAQRQHGRPRRYLSCLLMLAAGEKANQTVCSSAAIWIFHRKFSNSIRRPWSLHFTISYPSVVIISWWEQWGCKTLNHGDVYVDLLRWGPGNLTRAFKELTGVQRQVYGLVRSVLTTCSEWHD